MTTPRHAAPVDPDAAPRWWPPLLAAGIVGMVVMCAAVVAGGVYVADGILSWLAAR